MIPAMKSCHGSYVLAKRNYDIAVLRHVILIKKVKVRAVRLIIKHLLDVNQKPVNNVDLILVQNPIRFLLR